MIRKYIPQVVIQSQRGITIFVCIAIISWVLGAYIIHEYKVRAIFEAINSDNSPGLDILMPFLTFMGEGYVMIIVLLFLLLVFKRFRNWQFVVLALACVVVPSIITNLLKAYFVHPRPLNLYKADLSWIHLVKGYPKYHNYSFPSGHTTGAFAFFAFLSLLLNKRWALVALVFIAFSLAAGYSRIYLAQHFFLDVWAGSIVGTAGCYITYRLLNLLPAFGGAKALDTEVL